MPEQVKYKRQLKNFLIHKPLQREYTLLMIGVMMTAVLCVVMIIHFTMKQALMGNPYRIGSVSPYEILSDLSQQLVMRVSLILFFFIVLATGIGIVFLHRVAGPVYRFRVILHKIISGHIPDDIKLRERDYFKEVAEDFNLVFNSMRQKKILVGEVLARLDQIRSYDVPTEARALLDHIKQTLEKI